MDFLTDKTNVDNHINEQLEAGTELSFVTRSNSSSITNYPLPASDSKVKENNTAAFVAYNFNLEKVGNISAGLRYEHVRFDYTDYLDAANNMTRYQDERLWVGERSSGMFFPSLLWARQFGHRADLAGLQLQDHPS